MVENKLYSMNSVIMCMTTRHGPAVRSAVKAINVAVKAVRVAVKAFRVSPQGG